MYNHFSHHAVPSPHPCNQPITFRRSTLGLSWSTFAYLNTLCFPIVDSFPQLHYHHSPKLHVNWTSFYRHSLHSRLFIWSLSRHEFFRFSHVIQTTDGSATLGSTRVPEYPRPHSLLCMYHWSHERPSTQVSYRRSKTHATNRQTHVLTPPLNSSRLEIYSSLSKQVDRLTGKAFWTVPQLTSQMLDSKLTTSPSSPTSSASSTGSGGKTDPPSPLMPWWHSLARGCNFLKIHVWLSVVFLSIYISLVPALVETAPYSLPHPRFCNQFVCNLCPPRNDYLIPSVQRFCTITSSLLLPIRAPFHASRNYCLLL